MSDKTIGEEAMEEYLDWLDSRPEGPGRAVVSSPSPYQAWLAAKEKYEPKWISVNERLPDEDVLVLVFIPAEYGAESGLSFDLITEGVWDIHNQNYEHFIAVGGYSAGGEDCSVTGPSKRAPYTYWMPLNAAPQEQCNEQ